jgi:CheY-like chemotaxis protein
MRFLIVDDTPEALKPLAGALRESGHETTTARDLSLAWLTIEKDRLIDLVVIDIALDRYIREFADEQRQIREGLAAHGHEDLPMSGQALGLRLWRRRRELHMRYCYTTNHMYLWLPNLDRGDPEFAGGRAVDHPTVLDKSTLWQHNVESKLMEAYGEWAKQGWLGE